MVPLNAYTYAQISICSLLIHIVYPQVIFLKIYITYRFECCQYFRKFIFVTVMKQYIHLSMIDSLKIWIKSKFN